VGGAPGSALSADRFRIDGKLALVTGGGSGIGFAIAAGLAEAGGRIVIVGRDAAKLERAAKFIRARGNACFFVSADLTDRDVVAALPAKIEAEHGGVDILVNNAGNQHRAPFPEFPIAAWDAIVATHLSAAFLLTQPIVRGMIERGGGKVINTLSLNALLGRASIVPYATVKGGLQMMTRGLAVELVRHNIQVNGIAPGFIRTELNRALQDDAEFDAWTRKRTPAGRWGDPDDIVGAAVFLASQASDFVTGQTIFVDGGVTAAV
jgi:gluconate 5-dehydrogenase